MKQKLQSGFTLIEMLVVIGIMGLVASIFIANFAAFSGPRNLRIATNELVSNLRKIQSYTLSSRNSPSGLAVKYYLLKLSNAAGSNRTYQIQSVNSDYSFSSNIESINLPAGIVVRTFSTSPQGLQLAQPVGAAVTYPQCAQVAFSLPFRRIYIHASATNTCTFNTLVTNPTNLVGMANSKLTIVLVDTATAATSTIIINGITGAVCVPVGTNSC